MKQSVFFIVRAKQKSKGETIQKPIQTVLLYKVMLRCRQVERQRVLVPPFVGSNPTSAVIEQMLIFALHR